MIGGSKKPLEKFEKYFVNKKIFPIFAPRKCESDIRNRGVA